VKAAQNVTKPPFEVADIIRAHGNSFVDKSRSWLTWLHLRVLFAIEHYRTAALGGHLDRCRQCGFEATSFNSCRSRHCPKCQTNARDNKCNSVGSPGGLELAIFRLTVLVAFSGRQFRCSAAGRRPQRPGPHNSRTDAVGISGLRRRRYRRRLRRRLENHKTILNRGRMRRNTSGLCTEFG
jgi:hypothetical protein